VKSVEFYNDTKPLRPLHGLYLHTALLKKSIIQIGAGGLRDETQS
jgi:hypothetical protein